MYLEGKIFIFKTEEVSPVFNSIFPDMKEFRVQEITWELAYWRKVNHIHQWFVDNVQKGEDDCGNYWVDRDKLIQLKELCEKTVKEKTMNYLPPQGGFFFGATDDMEYYLEQTQYTIDVINKVLKMPKNIDIHYSSSW